MARILETVAPWLLAAAAVSLVAAMLALIGAM